MAIFGTGYDPSLQLLLNKQPSLSMANKLTGKVTSSGRAVESELSKAQRDFLAAVAGSQLQFDPNADEATALERMGAGYSGPTSLFDFEKFNANDFIEKASEAERNANLLGSSGGIFELLRDQYGDADVMPLDVAMAQHAGGKQFATTKDQYDDILDMFGDTLESTEKKAWNARVASQNAAMQYRDLYGQRVETRQAAEKAAWEAAQAKQLAEWQAAQQAALQQAQAARPVYTPPAVPQHVAPVAPAMPVSTPTSGFQPTFQTPYQAPKKAPAKKAPAPAKPAAKKPVAKKPAPAPAKKTQPVKKKKKAAPKPAVKVSYAPKKPAPFINTVPHRYLTGD